jgi:hypothetical protein
MAKDTKSSSFIEKADRIITAATAIPVFSGIFKKAFDFGKEHFKDEFVAEFKKAIGNDTDQAAKDPEDEQLYGFAINTLSPMEKKVAKSFEFELRAFDKKKAESYVLWVAKIVKRFEKTIKKTTTPPKNSTDPKEESTIVDISEGCIQGALFISDVIENPTFQERVSYLDGSNVFSLISEKKSSLIGEAVKSGKKDVTNGIQAANSELGKLTDWLDSKLR